VNQRIIRPQAGPQEAFLSSSADIVIFGGAAGGGKTYGLLMEPLRHVHNPQFNGVIFRQQSTQVRSGGGLWDTSQEIYIATGARPRETTLEWLFPSGAKLQFAHMEHLKDRLKYQGAQFAYIGWDEMTHFSKQQFFYMLSRSRSMSGVRPYVRGTCNPDPDSFVKDLILWWLDENGEYADLSKSGVIRWFVHSNDQMHWADRPDELVKKFPKSMPKSFTFIPSSVYDNKILLETDPEYLANLMALPRIERERLLGGNWRVRASAGDYFKERWFPIVEAPPVVRARVRGWDRAATKPSMENPDPDWTAGVLMSVDKQGRYFIEDVVRFRDTARQVKLAVINTATRDGDDTWIGLLHDPGQAGKVEIAGYIDDLGGYPIETVPELPGRTKEVKAATLSVQAEAGNIYLVRGDWNRAFIDELVNFPLGAKDDQLDGAYACYKVLKDRAPSIHNHMADW